MSWALTGFSVNRQAQPTAGYRLDVLGAVRTESEVAGDATLFLTMVGFGANSATTSLMTGNRDPNGLVSALPGTLYLRSDGVNSNLYENVSVGPGVGTSWTPVASLAAVPTWAAVLGAGNTSGGTDAVMSNPDELRWEDGATVTRRSDDLNGGEPRTRYFTAAAALAATLSIATATGVMSYTDDFTLASPSPVLTEGDDTGSPVQRMRKSGAGQTEIEWNSGGVTVWQDGVDASENRWWARSGINFPIFLPVGSETTELRDTLIHATRPDVVVQVGDNTGTQPQIQIRAAAASSNYFSHYQNSVRMWDTGQTHNDANWYVDRFVGGVFTDSMSVSNATGLWTFPQSITVLGTTPRVTVGDYSASGFIDLLKPAAGEMVIAFHSNDVGPATRWEIAETSDEALRFRAYNNVSAFLAETTIDNATHLWTYPGSSTWASANPVRNFGNATGTPVDNISKLDAGSYFRVFYNGVVSRWVERFQTDETYAWERRDLAEVTVNFPLAWNAAVTIAATQTTFGDALTVWDYLNAFRQLGSGLGSPGDNILKAEAGEYVATYYSAAQPRWQFPYVPADESLRGGRFSTAGAAVNNPFLFSAADTLATTLSTFGDATIQETYLNILHVFGDSLGSPTLRSQKSDAGESYFYHYSAGVPRWLLPYVNTSEQLGAGRYDAAGVNVNFPLVFDNPSQVTRLNDATVWLTLPSPIFQVGDATGSPDELKYKADAGEYDEQWFNVLALRWVQRHRTDEAMEMQRRDAAGAFVNNPWVFTPSATAAASVTTLGDASTVWGYVDPYLQVGGSTTALWTLDFYKDDAGSGSIGLWNEATRRFYIALTTAENTQMASFSAAAALLTLIQFQAGVDQLLFCYTPSPVIETGDNTGGPAWITNKADASSTTRDIVSAAVTRFRELVSSAEEVFHQKFTAAPALETEIAYLASGFVRIQTHWGVTDATTLPAATAGYAKFAMDSAANGRPKLVEGDGSIEQLGIGVTSQAMPVADRETTDLVVANTVVETDIFSYSIPANTLGATGVLHCELGGFIHCEVAATLQIRIYLGATTIYDSTTNTLSATTEDDAAFFILVDLGNQNATNDQAGDGFIMISNASNATTGVGALSSGAGGQASTPISLGDGAVDTTAAQTFRISVTWSVADANNRLVRRNAYATLAAAA